MTTVLYVILAILAFGVLIFIHEGGHFVAARIFKVSIYEFSIGMGPKIWGKKSEKTGIDYSLRALPIGGYVSMAGEDEESDDPNAFNKKPVWQRLIITVAGAATNLIVGFLVTAILVCSSEAIGGTTVAAFTENAKSQECGLQVGDTITAVNGTRVHIADDLLYEIMRQGIEPLDLTVVRNGESMAVENVEFPQISQSGVAFGINDFQIYAVEKSFGNLCYQSFWRSTYTVRMIWESLYDLITGRYGVEAVSGPVGVTEALTDAAETGTYSFVSLLTVISINLGVMNLLPLPALDGGRIVFLLIELVRRKPMKAKIEAYINAAGLAILLMLMAVICVKDIIGLF